jgi:hypothetical protein
MQDYCQPGSQICGHHEFWQPSSGTRPFGEGAGSWMVPTTQIGNTLRLPGTAPTPILLLRLEQCIPMDTNTQVTRTRGKHFDGGKGILIGGMYAVACTS